MKRTAANIKDHASFTVHLGTINWCECVKYSPIVLSRDGRDKQETDRTWGEVFSA